MEKYRKWKMARRKTNVTVAPNLVGNRGRRAGKSGINTLDPKLVDATEAGPIEVDALVPLQGGPGGIARMNIRSAFVSDVGLGRAAG